MPGPVLLMVPASAGHMLPAERACFEGAVHCTDVCRCGLHPCQASCLLCVAGHDKEKESLVAPAEASPIVEQAQDAAAGPADHPSAQAAAPAAVPVRDEAAASSVAPVQQLLQEPQQPRRGLRAGLQAVRQQWPQVAAVWRRAYWVDFILSLKVLPLQVGCCDWQQRLWRLTVAAWAAS